MLKKHAGKADGAEFPLNKAGCGDYWLLINFDSRLLS